MRNIWRIGKKFVYILPALFLVLFLDFAWHDKTSENSNNFDGGDPKVIKFNRNKDNNVMKHSDEAAASEYQKNENIAKAQLELLQNDAGGGGGGDYDVELPDLSKLDRTRVFYNRIPKSGSTTTIELAKTMRTPNGYTLYVRGGGRNLRPDQEKALAKEFQELDEYTLYIRHIMYPNFTSHGYKQPVFINLVRDPVDRIASLFYWGHGGWQNRRALYQKIDLNKTNDDIPADKRVKRQAPAADQLPKFDQCIQNKNGIGCGCKDFDMTHYLCGLHNPCGRKNPAALQKAKNNIVKNYLAVGITEDMESFFYVLEKLLPEIFYNATGKYKEYGEYLKYMTTSRGKKTVLPATRAIMKPRLEYDYDIYNFAKQYFYALLNKVKTLEASGVNFNRHSTHRPRTRAIQGGNIDNDADIDDVDDDLDDDVNDDYDDEANDNKNNDDYDKGINDSNEYDKEYVNKEDGDDKYDNEEEDKSPQENDYQAKSGNLY